MQKKFYYMDGQEVLEGDRVLINGENMAFIEKDLQPETEEAEGWACFETGGLLIHFDDGDLWVQEDTDEGIDLVARAEEHTR